MTVKLRETIRIINHLFAVCFCFSFQEIRVSKNEIIFEKDDEEDNPLLYIINKGHIEIFVETDKGDNEITLI